MARKPLDRNYAAWLVADTGTQLGASIRNFALPVLTLLVTGSAAAAGSIGALSSAVVAVLALFGGVLVDSFDRRKLLLLSTILAVVIFTAATIWSLVFGLSLALLIIVGVVTGIKGGLLGSTSEVLLRSVVPESELPRAMSVNQGRDAVVELGGAPLSGFLVSISRYAPFIAEVVTNVVALVAVFMLREREDQKHQPEKLSSSPKDIFGSARHGIVFVFKNRFMRMASIVSALFFPLLNGLILLFVLGTVNEGGSTITAGLVNTAVAVGVLAGSFTAGWLVDHVRTGVLAVIAFVAPLPFAAGALLLPNDWLRFAMLIPLVAFLPAANAAFGGFTMVVTPKHLLGRYFSVLQLAGMAITPLISLAVGFGLQYIGFTATGVTLIVCATLVAAVAAFNSQLRHIPLPDQWAEYALTLNIKDPTTTDNTPTDQPTTTNTNH